MNEYTLSEIAVGMKASFERTITREMEEMFRKISGDDNPLHWDDEYAGQAGGGRFNGHVCYGMLTASLYSAMAGMYLGKIQPDSQSGGSVLHESGVCGGHSAGDGGSHGQG